MPKTPIDLADIRKGDLIRWESNDASTAWTACEYVAERDSHRASRDIGQHYLLDRPKPPVDLPTEDHHIGWLTAPNSRVVGSALGEWHFGTDITASGFPEGISHSAVTEWIPATAVPTEALDELRAANNRAHDATAFERAFDIAHIAILKFLRVTSEADA